MFVFNRPFAAVAAGIGFALGMVILSGLCDPPAGRHTAAASAPAAAGCGSYGLNLCPARGLRYRARRIVTFPFLPPAARFRSRVGFRV